VSEELDALWVQAEQRNEFGLTEIETLEIEYAALSGRMREILGESK
jgi:hypothetical protein